MLEGVIRGTKKPPRIVIYGPPKIGKSTLGSESDNPIFVTTEDGVDNLPVDQFGKAENWEKFIDNISQVANNEHEYKTLIVDTINGAAELAAQHVCATQFKNDWGPKGFGHYGQGFASTSEESRRLLPIFDQCRERGMTVILLAHTGVQNVSNPVDGDYQKFTPNLDKRIWARFAAWSDIILRADFEYSVIEKNGKKIAVGTNTRILKAAGSQAEDAGCRVGYDLPDELPLSWNALSTALGKPNGIVDKVNELWHLFGEAEAAKCLRWMGISELKDLEKVPSQKVKQVLNGLKIKETK